MQGDIATMAKKILYREGKSLSTCMGLYILVAVSIVPLVFLSGTQLFLALAINLATAIGTSFFISLTNASFNEKYNKIENITFELKKPLIAVKSVSDYATKMIPVLSETIETVVTGTDDIVSIMNKKVGVISEKLQDSSKFMSNHFKTLEDGPVSALIEGYKDRALKESKISMDEMLSIIKDGRKGSVGSSTTMESVNEKLQEVLNISTEVRCIADWGNMIVASKAFDDSITGRYGGEMSLLAEELGNLVSKSIEASNRMDKSIKEIEPFSDEVLECLKERELCRTGEASKLEDKILESYGAIQNTVQYLSEALNMVAESNDSLRLEMEEVILCMQQEDRSGRGLLKIVTPLNKLQELLLQLESATAEFSEPSSEVSSNLMGISPAEESSIKVEELKIVSGGKR